MAKVSEEARKKYQQKIREFRKSADDLLEREKHVHAIMRADDRGAEYKKLLLAEENMNLVSYYLIMDRLSVILLGVQNQAALNDAKRTYYKILKYLEEVFTDLIDVPFSDYEEALSMVEAFPEMKKYELIRKLGLTLDLMIEYYGENNRWKWAFVELRGRLGTLAKNCINLKKFVAGMDPRFDGFQQRIEHLHLTKRLLREAADNYRKKYELATKRIDDFRSALNYLGALKRLSLLLGQQSETEDLKKKIEIWKTRMDQDIKKGNST